MQQRKETLTIAWYTRREGIVRGPFEPGHITRYILLGRIRLDDELSHVQWRRCCLWKWQTCTAGKIISNL
jgi:hypothetical protein